MVRRKMAPWKSFGRVSARCGPCGPRERHEHRRPEGARSVLRRTRGLLDAELLHIEPGPRGDELGEEAGHGFGIGAGVREAVAQPLGSCAPTELIEALERDL